MLKCLSRDLRAWALGLFFKRKNYFDRKTKNGGNASTSVVKEVECWKKPPPLASPDHNFLFSLLLGFPIFFHHIKPSSSPLTIWLQDDLSWIDRYLFSSFGFGNLGWGCVGKNDLFFVCVHMQVSTLPEKKEARLCIKRIQN